MVSILIYIKNMLNMATGKILKDDESLPMTATTYAESQDQSRLLLTGHSSRLNEHKGKQGLNPRIWPMSDKLGW